MWIFFMNTTIILILFILLYVLIMKRIIKLNALTGLLLICFVVGFTVFTFNQNKHSQTFTEISNAQVEELWINYRDLSISDKTKPVS